MTRVSTLRSAFPLLAAAVLLTGCDPILRFYGDDYGNSEAYQEQLVVLVDDFAASLERNRADLVRLVQVAGTNPALVPYAEQMTILVATQEVALAEQLDKLEWLVEDGDYRELHRHYGAFVTQQQMINDRYSEIVRRIGADDRVSNYVDHVVDGSRYAIVPPQYDRIGNRLRTPSLPLQIAAPAPAAPVVPLPDSTMTTLSDTTSTTPAQ